MRAATPLETQPSRPSGGTTTLLDPRLQDADTDDEVFHYVRKDKITESAVLGTMVTALCGKVFPVTKAPKPGSPVCPSCAEMMGLLRAFGPSGGDGDGSAGSPPR